MGCPNGYRVEHFTAYLDHSGVQALLRVNGMLFACHLTSEVKIFTVQGRNSSIAPGARRLKLAKWAFEKFLSESFAPEYLAATRALYASSEVAS